jgi:hypothetical protein
MKISMRQSSQTANALLVVLLVAGVLTACMGSYLALTSAQNQSVMRSLCWNAALPLAEAGAEEALSQISRNMANWNVDGWVGKGTNFTKPPRAMGDGYYSVTIQGTPQTLATITSVGSAHWMDSTYVSRTVQVTAQTVSIPTPVGLVASNIFFGGGFSADSYDSTNPLYRNTNMAGMYDPTRSTAEALVATPNLTFTMGGSSHIYGYVATGPGGSVSPKGAAIVGDKSYSTKGSIQAGHFTNNFTTPLPDVQVPFQSADAPVAGTVNGNSYNYVLSGGKYLADSIDGLANLYVSGNSILYVTGNVSVNKIVFAPGAHLDLFIASPSIAFYPTLKSEDDNGNQSLAVAPKQFNIWGLPSCKSMDMSGGKTSSFVGVIYAPEADLKATAGGDFYGAFVAGSFTCAGSYFFHYDSSLANSVTPIGVRILSWLER